MSIFQDITNVKRKSSSSMASVFDSSCESTPAKHFRGPQIVGGQFSRQSNSQTQKRDLLAEASIDDLKHEILGIQRSFQRSSAIKDKNALITRFNDVISRVLSQPLNVQNKLVPFILKLHETELVVETCVQISRFAKNMKSDFVETAKILMASSGGLFRLCQDSTRFKRFSKQNQSTKPVQCIKSILANVHITGIASQMITMAQIHPQWECQILQLLRYLFSHSPRIDEVEEISRKDIIAFTSKMLTCSTFDCRKEAKRLFKVIHKKMPVLAQELSSEVDPRWLPKVSEGPNFEDSSNVKLGAIYQKMYQNSKNDSSFSSLDVSMMSGTTSCEMSFASEPDKENIHVFPQQSKTALESNLSDGDLVERFTPKPHMTQMNRLADIAAADSPPTQSFHELAPPRLLPEDEERPKPTSARLPTFSPNSQISAITAQLAQVNAILANAHVQTRSEFSQEPSEAIESIGKQLASANEAVSEGSENLSAPVFDDDEICLAVHDSFPIPPYSHLHSESVSCFQDYAEKTPHVAEKACNLLTLLEGSSEECSVPNSPGASINEKDDAQSVKAVSESEYSALSLCWSASVSSVVSVIALLCFAWLNGGYNHLQDFESQKSIAPIVISPNSFLLQCDLFGESDEQIIKPKESPQIVSDTSAIFGPRETAIISPSLDSDLEHEPIQSSIEPEEIQTKVKSIEEPVLRFLPAPPHRVEIVPIPTILTPLSRVPAPELDPSRRTPNMAALETVSLKKTLPATIEESDKVPQEEALKENIEEILETKQKHESFIIQPVKEATPATSCPTTALPEAVQAANTIIFVSSVGICVGSAIICAFLAARPSR